MTTEAIRLEIEPREILGKKVKQLRRTGTIPVHLYGPGVEVRPLQCDQKLLLRALSQAGNTNPIAISVRGEIGERLTFPREIQWNPVRGNVLHVDFLAVDANLKVSAQVPISLVGESPGVRESGGSVAQVLFTLNVSALPMQLPNEIDVDLAMLVDPNSIIRAADILLPADVELATDPEAVVVRVDSGQLSGEAAMEDAAGDDARPE